MAVAEPLYGAAADCERWTPSERRALKKAYPSGGIRAARHVLPGRTDASIYHEASRLGLQGRRRRWTPSDWKKLRWLWGTNGLAFIAREMRRTENSVYHYAKQAGLTRGAPQGCEYLTVAADRLGVSRATLRHILHWAGVELRVTASRPPRNGERPKWIFHVVDSVDAEMAVEKWCRSESLCRAAERYGVCEQTVLRWCRFAGIALRRLSAKRRSEFRVLPEELERAKSEWDAWLAKSELPHESARRHGVTRPTLMIWLRDAGAVAKGRVWRVEKDLVDRVVAQRRARTTCRARGRLA